MGLFDAALAFRPRMSGSEWAERYGRIPKGTGAESGPVTLYGYQRGLLDAMCDPRIPLVTVLKAARVGYTRCFTLALGYHLDHDPTLCTIAQPTIPDAEEFGGTEIAPMLRETPVLASLLRSAARARSRTRPLSTSCGTAPRYAWSAQLQTTPSAAIPHASRRPMRSMATAGRPVPRARATSSSSSGPEGRPSTIGSRSGDRRPSSRRRRGSGSSGFKAISVGISCRARTAAKITISSGAAGTNPSASNGISMTPDG